MSAAWEDARPLLRKWWAVLAAASFGRDQAEDDAATDGKLSLGDLVVFMWILEYGSEKPWSSFPSIATLVRVTGMSKSTVVRAINRLEEAGFLEVRRGDRTTSNTFNPSFLGAAVVMARKERRAGVIDDNTSGFAADNTPGVTEDNRVVSPVNFAGVTGEQNLVSPKTTYPDHYPDAISVGSSGPGAGTDAPYGAPPDAEAQRKKQLAVNKLSADRQRALAQVDKQFDMSDGPDEAAVNRHMRLVVDRLYEAALQMGLAPIQPHFRALAERFSCLHRLDGTDSERVASLFDGYGICFDASEDKQLLDEVLAAFVEYAREHSKADFGPDAQAGPADTAARLFDTERATA